jgi:hypothetical protein
MAQLLGTKAGATREIKERRTHQQECCRCSGISSNKLKVRPMKVAACRSGFTINTSGSCDLTER